MQQIKWFLIAAISLVAMLFALHRDVYLRSVTGTGDMRNRIVGARLLQAKANNIYTYHYTKGDAIQFYDPQNSGQTVINNITASPFFLMLLSPICNLTQYQINFINYSLVLLGMSFILLLLFFKIRNSKYVAIAFAIIVGCFYWQAWVSHLIASQMYFHFSFIFFILYCIYNFLPHTYLKILAGVLMAVLILVKVNYAFLFVPFILIFKKSYYSLIACFFCVGLYAVMVLNSVYYKQVWKQYTTSLKANIAQAQGVFETQINEPAPQFKTVEDIHLDRIVQLTNIKPVTISEETNNFFNVIWFATGKSISRVTLAAITCILVLILFCLAVFKNNHKPLELYQIFLCGFAFYIISDFFGPIFRHPYYSMQWIPALAIVALHFSELPKVSKFFLWIGLIIFAWPTTFFMQQLTLAEICLLLTIITAVFWKKNYNTI